MTVKEEAYTCDKKVSRPWHEWLIVPVLIAGGLLTLLWILALMGLAWRIVSAVMRLPG